MTAEQPPTNGQLFPIPTFTTTTTTTLNENVNGKIVTWATTNNNIPKKKRRLSMTEEESNKFPPEKFSKKDDTDQVEETLFIDTTKMSQKDILLAYKRIWDNLDMSKPTDIKLEPFVWHKIREYQKKNLN